MVGDTARTPMSRRNSGESESFADMVFRFLEEGESSPDSSCNSGDFVDIDGDDENSSNIVEENKAFWEAQNELLQATLSRSSSIESRIRHATKEALRESKLAGTHCVCRRPVAGGCRNCLRREISNCLRNAGYNSATCKSKWRSSPDIPSGEHTYVEVVDNSSAKKGEVRVVIELNFRAEFEMARASEEYNRLISRLPELFVGKAERLQALIKILCSAAKKCMKENKMHMGPWRKHKYMQAKWIGTCERITPTPILPVSFSDRLPKPRASMLTFNLRENFPGLHCTTVEVV